MNTSLKQKSCKKVLQHKLAPAVEACIALQRFPERGGEPIFYRQKHHQSVNALVECRVGIRRSGLINNSL